MDTTGNTVLVTGGGSGIGLELTRALAARGNRVIVCSRSERSLERARSVAGVTTVRRDLQSAEQIADLLHWLRTDHPAPNVFVNNAGVMRQHQVLSTESATDIGEEIATNLLAPIRLSLGLLSTLRRHPRSAIVMVSSALAWVPMVTAPGYSASKAGLHSFTQSLRDQTRATGIHVMEVLPPTVDTAMTRGMVTHKITPEVMADAIMLGLKADRREVVIGQARVLRALATVAPGLARRILAKAS